MFNYLFFNFFKINFIYLDNYIFLYLFVKLIFLYIMVMRFWLVEFVFCIRKVIFYRIKL